MVLMILIVLNIKQVKLRRVPQKKLSEMKAFNFRNMDNAYINS